MSNNIKKQSAKYLRKVAVRVMEPNLLNPKAKKVKKASTPDGFNGNTSITEKKWKHGYAMFSASHDNVISSFAPRVNAGTYIG